MKRNNFEFRHNFDQTAKDLEFDFAVGENGERYWDESAYYSFSLDQIENHIEGPTEQLHTMCKNAVKYAVENNMLSHLGIPEVWHERVAQSWRQNDFSLYGRFDLVYDGKNPAKMLEYNADTPTGLYEAAVIQWYWLEDCKKNGSLHAYDDQYNSLHESLIDQWKLLKSSNNVLTLCSLDNVEDWCTIKYLADTAHSAGFSSTLLTMDQIGLMKLQDGNKNYLIDNQYKRIENMFKLCPWEWIFDLDISNDPAMNSVRFVEPLWKSTLNKGILPILWKLYPDHPNLLPAYFEYDDFVLDDYVIKPIHSREGANVVIVKENKIALQSEGTYVDSYKIVQKLVDIPYFDGNYPVIGSWIVGDNAHGMGIRESTSLITNNMSRFVPHVIR